jgi:hypothetical protein
MNNIMANSKNTTSNFSDEELNKVAPHQEKISEYWNNSEKKGQEVVKTYWKGFTQKTRDNFIKSGCYDNNGNRIEPFFLTSIFPCIDDSDENYCQQQEKQRVLVNEIEELEHHLGVLKLCASCELNSPSETSSAKNNIPDEAFGFGEITNAYEFLLILTKWHEPSLLRLALSAIVKNQKAKFLANLPAETEKTNWGIIIILFLTPFLAILNCLLYLSSPFILSYALVSAFKGNVEDTAYSFYLLGLLVFIKQTGKNIKSDLDKKNIPTQDRKNYEAWHKLNYAETYQFSTGVGAKFVFKKMVKDGIDVPPIVFDLCAALESATLRKREISK